ncbi:MAG TPA: hypothetical protein VF498_09685 [Anaerolineales bacterium]
MVRFATDPEDEEETERRLGGGPMPRTRAVLAHPDFEAPDKSLIADLAEHFRWPRPTHRRNRQMICPYPDTTCPELAKLRAEVARVAERLARVEVRASPAVPPGQRDHTGYVTDWAPKAGERGQ